MGILAVNSILLWVVLIFNLLLTLALVRSVNNIGSNNLNREEIILDELKSGDIAPDFKAITLDGKEITLKDYINQSMVFVFVSSKCAPCKERISEIEKILPIVEKAGIDIILVSNDDLETSKQHFLEYDKFNNVLVAPRTENQFMYDYKVPATPYFCLVDNKGLVQTNGFFDQKWSTLVLQWVSITSKIKPTNVI